MKNKSQKRGKAVNGQIYFKADRQLYTWSMENVRAKLSSRFVDICKSAPWFAIKFNLILTYRHTCSRTFASYAGVGDAFFVGKHPH